MRLFLTHTPGVHVPKTKNNTESAQICKQSCIFLRADAHLLGENVSLPYMDVDSVERCWKEQILALTVKRLTLVKVQHKIRLPGNTFPQNTANTVTFESSPKNVVNFSNMK